MRNIMSFILRRRKVAQFQLPERNSPIKLVSKVTNEYIYGCDRKTINILDRRFVTRILCAVSEGLVHILLEQTCKNSC